MTTGKTCGLCLFMCDDVIVADDQWTVNTKDGAASAHFEHTVVVTDNEPLIMTQLIP